MVHREHGRATWPSTGATEMVATSNVVRHHDDTGNAGRNTAFPEPAKKTAANLYQRVGSVAGVLVVSAAGRCGVRESPRLRRVSAAVRSAGPVNTPSKAFW